MVATAYLAAPDASGLAKVKCKPLAGVAVVDPIVRHGQPVGTGHLHDFFGNTTLLSLADPNSAEYADLAGKSTACRDTTDTAAYWAPALLDNRTGEALVPQAFTAYYRSWDGKSTGNVEAFPPDTRLVAQQTSTSPGAHGWSCGQNSTTPPQDTIPDCSGYDQGPGTVLTAHVNFPSCWTGVPPSRTEPDPGDTSDNAQYAYPIRASGKGWVCPAGYPRRVPQLRVTIQYPNPDKVPVAYLQLASDSEPGGAGMHADFWNTWQQTGLQNLINNCIRVSGPARECAQ